MHTGLEPCQEASHMSFLAFPLSGAGYFPPMPQENSLFCVLRSHHGTLSITQFHKNPSRSCSSCHESAKFHPGSLLSTDVQAWTDGSVPSTFSPSGAKVYIICNSCSTFTSLSFSAGPVCSSFMAESFALENGLNWFLTHLFTCHF